MPYKDPEQAKANARKRYLERQHQWKNPDGTWKKPKDPEARAAQRRKKWAEDSEHRARHKASRERTRKRREVHATCPICGVETKLVRDHCHATGKQREMICSACNLMLGHGRDDPETLLAGAEYLRRHAD